ncbi:hypothetical protein COBT_000197 [Conglomerata obtusa]
MESNHRFVNFLNQENNSEYNDIIDGVTNTTQRIEVFDTLRRMHQRSGHKLVRRRFMISSVFERAQNTRALIVFFENPNVTNNIGQNLSNSQSRNITINQNNSFLINQTAEMQKTGHVNFAFGSAGSDRENYVNKTVAFFETLKNQQYKPKRTDIKFHKLKINDKFRKRLEEIVENTFKVLKCLNNMQNDTVGTKNYVQINIEQKTLGYRNYRRTLNAF